MATPERRRTRFLVVGSGVAGLHTAWRASQHGDVLLLTKRSLFDSATAYAQGGIAAALGAGDSPSSTARTRSPPARRCATPPPSRCSSRKVPRACASCRPPAPSSTSIRADKLKLGREAAHSRNRIVHAHGDQTGAEVARTLIERVRASKRIKVLERARVLDLIVARGAVRRGARERRRARRSRSSPTPRCSRPAAAARSTATRRTRSSRPATATPSPTAPASTLADMEFVQFHPTALDTPENPLALISEAVRGEGAMLVNDEGERFMREACTGSPSSRRATSWRARSSASRSGGRRSTSTRASSVADFAERFPGIFALCAARGIDPRQRPHPGDAGRALHDGRHRDGPRRPLRPRRGSTRAARWRARACTARIGSRRTRCSRGSCSPSAWRATSSSVAAARVAPEERSSGRCRRSPTAARRRSRPTRPRDHVGACRRSSRTAKGLRKALDRADGHRAATPGRRDGGGQPGADGDSSSRRRRCSARSRAAGTIAATFPAPRACGAGDTSSSELRPPRRVGSRRRGRGRRGRRGAGGAVARDSRRIGSHRRGVRRALSGEHVPEHRRQRHQADQQRPDVAPFLSSNRDLCHGTILECSGSMRCTEVARASVVPGRPKRWPPSAAGAPTCTASTGARGPEPSTDTRGIRASSAPPAPGRGPSAGSPAG